MTLRGVAGMLRRGRIALRSVIVAFRSVIFVLRRVGGRLRRGKLVASVLRQRRLCRRRWRRGVPRKLRSCHLVNHPETWRGSVLARPSCWCVANSTAASRRHYSYPCQQSPAMLHARVYVGTFYRDTALTRWKALTKLRPLPHIRQPGLAARSYERTSAVPMYRRFFMPVTSVRRVTRFMAAVRGEPKGSPVLIGRSANLRTVRHLFSMRKVADFSKQEGVRHDPRTSAAPQRSRTLPPWLGVHP